MSKQAIIALIIISILIPGLRNARKMVPLHPKRKGSTKTKVETQNHRESVNPESVKRQSGQIDYFLVTDPASPSYIDATNPGHGLTALNNQGNADNTASLQAIINYASRHERSIVYFPPGRYVIDSDVIIKGRVRMVGSHAGISLIETRAGKARVTTIGNTKANNEGQIQVDRLFFDGVNLRFGHKDYKKAFIFLSKCVFFSRNPGAIAKVKRESVYFKNITNIGTHYDALEYSVFLRDVNAFGLGSVFDFSDGIKIRNNIFGLDLERIDWMNTELSDPYWSTLKLKLNFLKSRFHLRNDQGYFKSSIYVGFTNRSLIQKNIFNGSPKSASLKHDHVVYLKGFDDMKFMENYARGWPSNAKGGIKARNGKNLVIARNYIDDTGILLYTHMEGRPYIMQYLYLGLKDVLVYGNHIVEKTNLGHRTAGIAYYEPHRHLLGDGKDENLTYSANIFEIIGASHSPPTEKCIFITNGNRSEHHVYRDNLYDNTNPPQPVTLEARHYKPSYEKGSISSTFVAPYVNMNLPNYTIPDYA